MVETLQPASNDGAKHEQGEVTDQLRAESGITIHDVREELAKTGEAFGDKVTDKFDSLKKLYEVTDEDRKEAIGTLDDEIPPITDPKVAENLKAAHAAIINGDTKALAAALAAYKDDPEMMKRFVAQLDADLKNANAGTRMALDKAGNVVIWGKGDVAMEVNPKDGSVTLRKIEHNFNGSITIKDGEVVGEDPAKVAKRIGDNAARNINRPLIFDVPIRGPHPNPRPGLEGNPQPKPPGGKGASDGKAPNPQDGEIVLPNPFQPGGSR